MALSFNSGSPGSSLTWCLKQCPLFCELSPDSLTALGDIIQPICFTKGANLFVQGQPIYGAFILSSGRVKLTSVTPSGSVASLAFAKHGDALGLSETVSGRCRAHSAKHQQPASRTEDLTSTRAHWRFRHDVGGS
jgi:CRP-like cAMP-binding protein